MSKSTHELMRSYVALVEGFTINDPSEEIPNVDHHSARIKLPPIDIKSVELDGVDRRDHPDYADAFISYAEFEDGTPLTDEELDRATDEYGDLINELANEQFYG